MRIQPRETAQLMTWACSREGHSTTSWRDCFPHSIRLDSRVWQFSCRWTNIYGMRKSRRCIFCKKDSCTSVSEEHVIPESLGNTTLILPPGIVCDGCNNYFSREVEKPFLESAAIKRLRSFEFIESKRGRIPPMEGSLADGSPVEIHPLARGKVKAFVNVPTGAFQKILDGELSQIIIQTELPITHDATTSRFLAKAALEAMALRILDSPTHLAWLVDDPQLDSIREHARRGTTSAWPFLTRRIYPAKRRWQNQNGESVQLVHETDFLVTPKEEMYFVMALFGLEMSINIAGPSVEGLQEWLDSHGGISPLYYGERADGAGLTPIDGDAPE